MANESFTQIAKSKGGFDRWSYNRIVEILDLIEGGGTGVQVPADWEADSGVTQVKNKPKINNKDLKSGDNTLDDLGIQAKLESGVNIKKLKVNDDTYDLNEEGTVEITTGGSGGTGDYPDLTNKPKIEKSDGSSVEIVDVHSAEYYDLANKVHTHKVADITDLDINSINTQLNALDNAVNSLADSKQPRLVDGENIATVTVNGTKHELTKEKDISITTGGGGEGTDDYNNLNNRPSVNGNIVEGNKKGEYYNLANLYPVDKVPATPVNGDLKVEKVDVEGVKHNKLSVYNAELGVWEELIQHFSGGNFSPDMENKFKTKQDELIATGTGQNLKTVNDYGLLGAGNIEVQEPLVSGETIKTVNGESLLGAGNLVIGGGGTSYTYGKVVIVKRNPVDDDLDDYLEGTYWINIEHGDEGSIVYRLGETTAGERYWEELDNVLMSVEELPPITEVSQGRLAYIGTTLSEDSEVYLASTNDGVPQWVKLNGTITYKHLPDKPAVNGATLAGDKNSTELGLPVKAPEGQVILSRSVPLPKICKTGTIWIDVTYLNIGTEDKAMLLTEDSDGTKKWEIYPKFQAIVDTLPTPVDLEDGILAVLRLSGYAPCSWEVYKVVSQKWVQLECNYGYTQLQDKPFINETRVAGNKSLEDYGIQAELIGAGEGQNIKTINGESLLGAGDITIEAGETNKKVYISTTDLDPNNYSEGTFWIVPDGSSCTAKILIINRGEYITKMWQSYDAPLVESVEDSLPDPSNYNVGKLCVLKKETMITSTDKVYIIIEKEGTTIHEWYRIDKDEIDYELDVAHKPKIEGHELVGNLSLIDLGVASREDFLVLESKVAYSTLDKDDQTHSPSSKAIVDYINSVLVSLDGSEEAF